jgi:hypothetical protein
VPVRLRPLLLALARHGLREGADLAVHRDEWYRRDRGGRRARGAQDGQRRRWAEVARSPRPWR